MALISRRRSPFLATSHTDHTRSPHEPVRPTVYSVLDEATQDVIDSALAQCIEIPLRALIKRPSIDASHPLSHRIKKINFNLAWVLGCVSSNDCVSQMSESHSNQQAALNLKTADYRDLIRWFIKSLERDGRERSRDASPRSASSRLVE